MTNREWLASMSDKEFAKWLDEHIDSCCACSHKEGYSCCDNPDDADYDCEIGRYKWLEQVHEEYEMWRADND